MAMGVAIAAVAAALPPLMWLFGSLLTVLNPIGLAIAAITTAFATNFLGIRSIVFDVIGSITNVLRSFNLDIGTALNIEDKVTDAPEITVPAPSLTIGSMVEPIVIPDISENIIVTEPTSLWDIYKNEGYDDYFTWEGFMEAASEAGWEGGALQPDTTLTLDLSGVAVATEGGESYGGQVNEAIRAAQANLTVDPVDLSDREPIPIIGASFSVDAILEGLSELLNLEPIADALSTARDQFVDAFEDIRATFAEADFSGVVRIGQTIAIGVGSIIGTLSTFVFSPVITAVIRTVGNLANIFTFAADGIKLLLDSLAIASTGDLGGALVALSGSILQFGLAILQFPVGIIDSIITSLGDLLGLEVWQIGDWLDALSDAINRGVAGVEEVPTMTLETPVDPVLVLEGGSIGLQSQFTQDLLRPYMGSVVETGFGEALQITIPTEITPDIAADILTFQNEIQNAMNTASTVAESQDAYEINAAFNLALESSGITVEDLQNFLTHEPVEVEPEIEVEPPTGVTISPMFSSALNTALATGISTEEATTKITEIGTSLATTFGDGSPAQSALMSFGSASAEIDGTITKIEALNTTSEEQLPIIATKVETETTRMTQGIDTVKTSIDQLILSLQGLNATTQGLDLTIPTTGSEVPVPEGSHAAGLDYVPHDGYLAELHKGEMVVPASEAAYLRASGWMSPDRGGGNVSSNQNTINISGVRNIEQLIYELRRRGYEL